MNYCIEELYGRQPLRPVGFKTVILLNSNWRVTSPNDTGSEQSKPAVWTLIWDQADGMIERLGRLPNLHRSAHGKTV